MRHLPPIRAGFMELDESSAEGAARETLEEAGAAIDVLSPFVHFDIPVRRPAPPPSTARLLIRCWRAPAPARPYSRLPLHTSPPPLQAIGQAYLLFRAKLVGCPEQSVLNSMSAVHTARHQWL